MAASKPETWVNKKNISALLGISVQAFSKWGVEPVGKEGRESFYTVRDCIDNRIAQSHNTATPGASTEDTKELARKKYEEDYLLAKERRIGQQQKNELQAGIVIPTEFATFALSKVASQIASVLDTLPLTMRRAHPDLESRHIDSFTREVAKARNHAAEVDEILPELVEEYVALINETK
jgi:phage terminase Nu1 subunit (DNA packaging protein)